jgi:hypothetical protein
MPAVECGRVNEWPVGRQAVPVVSRATTEGLAMRSLPAVASAITSPELASFARVTALFTRTVCQPRNCG